jgi:CHAT domain-containing protein/tetratricopeptide (TPR) repeat protein
MYIAVQAVVISALIASPLLAQCPRLTAGSSATVRIRPDRTACVLVRLTPGQSVQVSVRQPFDLSITVKEGGTTRTVDGFEFGRETVTLETPGNHRIEIRAVDRARHFTPLVVMRVDLSSEQAALWREAEDLATESKRDPSRESLTESMRIWKTVSDALSIARTYLKIGDERYEHADSSAARESYEEALGLCRTLEDFRCAGEAANNSGIVSQQLGDFEVSSERLEEAADDWRQIADRISEGITLSNLGLMYSQTGDYERALALLERSEIVLRGRDPVAHAKVLNSLGLCYSSMAEFEKARIRFQSALEVFKARRLPADMVRVRLNLGRTYLLEDRMALAEETLRRALVQARASSDRKAVADILSNLGQVMLKRDRIAEARSDFEEALNDDREMHDPRGEAFDLHYLGLVHRRLGKPDEAKELLCKALRIRTDAGLRDDASETLLAMTDLEAGTGNKVSARALAEQALTVLELVRSQVPGAALRASYYSRKRRFFDQLVDLTALGSDAESAKAALLMSERGRARALLDLLAEGSILHQIPQELAARRTAIQRRLDLLANALSTAPVQQQNGIREQIEAAVAEDEEVEAAVRFQLEKQNLGRPLDSVKQLQKLLNPDTGLVEFHLGANGSYLWVVRHDSLRMFRLPPRAEIEALATRAVSLFNRIAERRRSPEQRKRLEGSLRSLSQVLFGALDDGLLPQTVVLVPDGILQRVPFAALRDLRENAALGLMHDLIQIPSASLLATVVVPRRPSAFPLTVLAVADPVFDAGDSRFVPSAGSARSLHDVAPHLPRLPFAAELKTLSSLTAPSKSVVLRDFEANRREVESMNLGDFALIHFSTHALIDDRLPELSRIVLSRITARGEPVDGSIRPYQLSQFRLDGSIVVLSACQTAFGERFLGEGIAGFSSSLFHAGASQLVLTLADVDAEASSEFLSEVYRQYLGKGVPSMEHALTLARIAMARTSRWSDPYYWASIVVIGRPSP